MKTKQEKLDYIRDWQKRNWKRTLSYKSKWRESNPEKMQQCREMWKNNNKNRIAVVALVRRKRLYNSDPAFKRETNLRSKMNKMLRSKFGKNHDVFQTWLGCSINQFKKHLEALFKTGMNWSNRGRFGWHIDHIIPCDKFDFSIQSEALKCFHFTNTQPLWRGENIAKSNKLK